LQYFFSKYAKECETELLDLKLLFESLSLRIRRHNAAIKIISQPENAQNFKLFSTHITEMGEQAGEQHIMASKCKDTTF
jgi:hypothetical protein